MRGGLAMGLLFVIPGALVILALSVLYAYAADLGWFAALFLGIKAAVLAIVVQALLRIAGRALQTRVKQALALAAAADVVLIAGKGHEDYQEVAGQRLPFSDVAQVRAAWAPAGVGARA